MTPGPFESLRDPIVIARNPKGDVAIYFVWKVIAPSQLAGGF